MVVLTILKRIELFFISVPTHTLNPATLTNQDSPVLPETHTFETE